LLDDFESNKNNPEELEELDHFIEARQRQNEALKKMLENKLRGDKKSNHSHKA
jgi:hypothetical protein